MMHIHTKWLVDFVQTALQMPTWSGELVLGWFLGIGLPPVGRADAPYVSVWEGISNSADSADTRQRFAAKLGAAASEIRNQLVPVRSAFLQEFEAYPGQSVEGLWRLMFWLEQPDELGLFVRETVDCLSDGQMRWLESNELDYTRRCLVAAAIANQDTDQFESDWLLMLEGNSHSSRFQAGTRSDGAMGEKNMFLAYSPYRSQNAQQAAVEAYDLVQC